MRRSTFIQRLALAKLPTIAGAPAQVAQALVADIGREADFVAAEAPFDPEKEDEDEEAILAYAEPRDDRSQDLLAAIANVLSDDVPDEHVLLDVPGLAASVMNAVKPPVFLKSKSKRVLLTARDCRRARRLRNCP